MIRFASCYISTTIPTHPTPTNMCDNNTIALQTAVALAITATTLTAITLGLVYPFEMVRRAAERCDACNDECCWSIPILDEVIQRNGERCVVCGDTLEFGHSNVSFGYADYPRMNTYPPKMTKYAWFPME